MSSSLHFGTFPLNYQRSAFYLVFPINAFYCFLYINSLHWLHLVMFIFLSFEPKRGEDRTRDSIQRRCKICYHTTFNLDLSDSYTISQMTLSILLPLILLPLNHRWPSCSIGVHTIFAFSFSDPYTLPAFSHTGLQNSYPNLPWRVSANLVLNGDA